MAAASTTLLIRVVTDTSNSVRNLQAHGQQTSTWARGMQKAAVPALAVGTAAVVAADMVVDSAAKQERSMSAVDTVFGKSAGTVKDWAATAAESTGLAASEYATMASLIGSQLNNLGVPQGQVLGKTKDLITMGADLAATFGGPTDQAVKALSATLRGEYDPIERYGINVKQADVNARMLADGTSKLTGPAAKAARAAATLALIQEAGATTAGQFAKNSDTLGVQQQKTAASFENAKAAIGQALLPAMKTLAGVLKTVADVAQKHPKLFTAMIVAVIALAAAIMVMNVALAITSAVSAPITLTILAIVAAIVVFIVIVVLLWKKCAWFRTAVLATWAAIKVAAVATWRFIVAYIRTVVSVIVVVFRALLAAGRWVAKALAAAWRFLGKAIDIAASVIRGIYRGIVAAGRWLWAGVLAIVRGIAAAWRWVQAQIASARNVIVSTFQGLLNWIAGMAGRIRTLFSGIKSSALDWLVSAFRTAKDTIVGIWESILAGIQRVIDRIRGIIDSLIDKIRNIPVPKIPGLTALLSVAPPPPAPAPATGTTQPRSTGGSWRSPPAGSLAGATFELYLDGQIVEKAVTKATVRQNRILARRILNGRPAQ